MKAIAFGFIFRGITRVVTKSEIRRSLDLQAVFEKFSETTIERKNMSTKTNFKRVALVAVAALGLGVLTSVAPANAAAATAGQLWISTTASTTGAATLDGGGNSATATSVGWITQSSTTATSANGGLSLASAAVGTGVIYSGAKISLTATGTSATNGVSVVVTGGTLSSVASTGTTPTLAVSGSATTATSDGADARTLYGVFTVNAAVGSTATIAAYSGADVVGNTTATSGTLLGFWTLTVASASAAGTYSPTYSSIFTQTAVTKGTTAGGAAGTYVGTYDVSTRIDNGKVGVIVYQLADAYAGAVTSGTLSATATNSATINIVDAGADAIAGAYAASTSFDTQALSNTAYNGYIVVNQPVANTAGSTTVTITLDGTVLATKTLNWNGDAASISVDTANSVVSFINGQDEDTENQQSGIVYVVKDAAGNAITQTALPTISGATGSLVGASIGTTSNTTSGVLQTTSVGYGAVTMVVPSSALNGAGTYKLKVSNSAGTSIYSQEVKATVSRGGLNSFSASWDKASYNPGEIAVLTIQGKDVYGNLIGDGTEATGLSLTVAGSATAGFTSVGTACSATSAFSEGVITCKFAANTEGAWSYSVDVSTATPQSASVGALKITSGGGVSNADVLKAIVSLIASINKQIAALQKALLKK